MTYTFTLPLILIDKRQNDLLMIRKNDPNCFHWGKTVLIESDQDVPMSLIKDLRRIQFTSKNMSDSDFGKIAFERLSPYFGDLRLFRAHPETQITVTWTRHYPVFHFDKTPTLFSAGWLENQPLFVNDDDSSIALTALIEDYFLRETESMITL